MSLRLSMTSPSARTGKLVANLVLLVIGAIFLVPLLWLVFAAFNPSAGQNLTWPSHWSLSNFSAVLNGTLTWHPLINGLLISGFAALITACFSALCAYPLSRYRLRFGNSFLYTILFGASLPATGLVIPVYALFVNMHLINSLFGVTVFEAAGALPYSIWLTKNFMDGVPVDIEEAAWVDGASALVALRRVVLPLVLPGLLAMFVFTFIESWGNFFAPFILLISSNKYPMAVSVYQFFGQHGQVNYPDLAAYSIIYSAPIIVLYLLVQRHFTGAFRLEGGLKG